MIDLDIILRPLVTHSQKESLSWSWLFPNENRIEFFYKNTNGYVEVVIHYDQKYCIRGRIYINVATRLPIPYDEQPEHPAVNTLIGVCNSPELPNIIFN